jgi:pimeloyl-ACP methyl ester carboxylesterase
MPTVARTPEAFAKANGIELCWDSFGDSADPPLLLIMGLASQMIAWDEEFCAAIAARGYRVVRFDNRDVGRSTRLVEAGVPDVGAAMMAALRGEPVAAPYTLSDMANDAVGLLDGLAIDRAHVVGASMGGAIAQTMAIEHPERLMTLTSIMATTGAPGLPPPTPEAMAVLFKPPPVDEASYVESYGQTWRVLRAGSVPEEEARDPERARRLFARGLNPAGTARQLAAICASGSRQAALRSVRVPTLVIHGEADPLVPLACGIDTARSVPGARIETIPGMGHALVRSAWPRMIDAIVAHARRGVAA